MKRPRTKGTAPSAATPLLESSSAPTPRRTRSKHVPAESSISPDFASADAIAELAHGLFLSRGAVHGHDLDDWLEAERRILSTQGNGH